MFQEEAKLNFNDLNKLTLSQIVKKNYKAAAIFEKYKLDFCCRGNRPVAAACNDLGVNTSEIISELELLGDDRAATSVSPDQWDLTFLTDYIINTHHQYVRNMIPVLSAHTEKVATVHGKNHPETREIARTFAAVYKDLKQHMHKEEEILFPYIKRLVLIKSNGLRFEAPFFGTVNNPIKMMEAEHQNAGDELYAIRDLTNNYNAPEDACNTYRIMYQELKDFEEDLHRHVHLENNILFPKSIQLEKELSAV